MKCVCIQGRKLFLGEGVVSEVFGLVENFNNGNFSDTINVINVKTLHDLTTY